MRSYPVVLTADPNGGYVVTFSDVPEAITEGEDEAEALANAQDALESALSFYVERRVPLPTPSAGGQRVTLSSDAQSRLDLYESLRDSGTSLEALAAMLGEPASTMPVLLDLVQPVPAELVQRAVFAVRTARSGTVADAA